MSTVLEKMGLTKRAKVMIVIMVVLLVVYYVTKPSDPPPKEVVITQVEATSSDNTQTQSTTQVVRVQANSQETLGRDPFVGPAISQAQTSIPSVNPGSSITSGIVAVAQPQLEGTIIGTKNLAIISVGGESKSVPEGGTISGYTVAKVERKYVVLVGPAGQMTLRVGSKQ